MYEVSLVSYIKAPFFCVPGWIMKLFQFHIYQLALFIFSHAVGREKCFDVAIPNAVHCVGSMEAA